MENKDKTPLESFGENVKKNRKKLGFTQKELAEKVGITHEWVCKIEKGKAKAISSSLIMELGKALEMNVQFTVIDDLKGYVESNM